MSTTASAGRISTHDLEEHCQVLEPWDLILRQMSPGRFDGKLNYVQINGMLLYREHWSQPVMATGGAPAGYMLFGSLSASGILIEPGSSKDGRACQRLALEQLPRDDGRGEAACPQWLRRAWLLSAFAATEQAAVGSYRRFVAAGMGQPAPWEQLEHQVMLGSEEFVDNLRRRLPKDRDLSEVPRAQRRPLAKPLTEYAALYSDRDEAIVAAYASGGYTLKTSLPI
ncbi:MAG: hypothetical protein N838_26700 [Thiohalocapsa sp. PB-PSB1]|jgi:hypothetical protein|nr:MAG: hypothetical protein N838_26700 [Thiohalocapsa sp. PB-PSB1]